MTKLSTAAFEFVTECLVTASRNDHKITLNFALASTAPLKAEVLRQHFSPEKYLIKITPLNPTYQAAANGLASHIDPQRLDTHDRRIEHLREQGYEVFVSVGNV